ncbi:MAG: hypothetical protein Q9181_001255 [Wetmoreana brouardii]
MIHPFQRILICTLASQGEPAILLAASRSHIFSFSLDDGSLLSTWQSKNGRRTNSSDLNDPSKKREDPGSTGATEGNDHGERPTKRQKRSSSDKGSESSSAEIVTENGKSKPSKSTKARPTDPNVVNLASTADGQFVVAVTDEDKRIRVFRLSPDGILEQLSERSMPKRPCAITFTPDETTIICGDKFGDVYALPLLLNDIRGQVSPQAPTEQLAEADHPTASNKYVPSANSKTVHTLRNQKALQHQKSLTNQKPHRSVGTFEHQLLLGHVSLLTDVACVSIPDTDVAGSHEKMYLITADRDEHIRVSRGMPQAHIVEGFCLGHSQFVSQLCVPSWNTRLLISGGGDDFLLVWDWLSGRALHKVDLRSSLDDFARRRALHPSLNVARSDADRMRSGWNGAIAVTKILAAESKTATGDLRRFIILACEGLPGILIFNASEDGAIEHEAYLALPSNVIDINLSRHQDCIAYAMDTDHTAFSQSQLVDESRRSERLSIGIKRFSTETGLWDEDSGLRTAIFGAIRDRHIDNEDVEGQKVTKGGSGSLLYGLENLRKRGQAK